MELEEALFEYYNFNIIMLRYGRGDASMSQVQLGDEPNPTQERLERHLLWRRPERKEEPIAAELRRIDRAWFLTSILHVALFLGGLIGLVALMILSFPFTHSIAGALFIVLMLGLTFARW
jgi:hypothetical protein